MNKSTIVVLITIFLSGCAQTVTSHGYILEKEFYITFIYPDKTPAYGVSFNQTFFIGWAFMLIYPVSRKAIVG